MQTLFVSDEICWVDGTKVRGPYRSPSHPLFRKLGAFIQAAATIEGSQITTGRNTDPPQRERVG
jgi:hypothetical protein